MRGLHCAAIVFGLLVGTAGTPPFVHGQIGGEVPIWVDAGGRPLAEASEALAILRNAADDGLDPDDYDAASLTAQAVALEAQPRRAVEDAVSFDTALTGGMVRYFRHLHSGRVDPRAAGFRLAVPADDHDFAAIVRAAVARHELAVTVEEFRPPLALYRGLRGALRRYRSVAADPILSSLPTSAATVRAGDAYVGLPALHRLLAVLGDLPADTPAPSEPLVYDGVWIDGVKHFQLRHGLEPDGVLGKLTQEALRVPLSARVRQIELALERLRWLPHLGANRFVAVNIPMFRLWAWDSIPPDGAPSFDMGVIVGRALNTQTPVFVEEMTSVIFRPYWNIPSSILRHEILPAVERDPEYLQRHDMEIVSGSGDDARPVPATAANLVELHQGRLRVRQRPGPDNALGLVKFVFPNDENVYMHGTPAMQLFSRFRRDFSHGCVRLEDPVSLAEWVLKDRPEWSRDRIVAAMQGSRPVRVDLPRPIQVILFYITAVVLPEDGTVHFADDIYRHDAKLEKAIGARRPDALSTP